MYSPLQQVGNGGIHTVGLGCRDKEDLLERGLLHQNTRILAAIVLHSAAGTRFLLSGITETWHGR